MHSNCLYMYSLITIYVYVPALNQTGYLYASPSPVRIEDAATSGVALVQFNFRTTTGLKSAIVRKLGVQRLTT